MDRIDYTFLKKLVDNMIISAINNYIDRDKYLQVFDSDIVDLSFEDYRETSRIWIAVISVLNLDTKHFETYNFRGFILSHNVCKCLSMKRI